MAATGASAPTEADYRAVYNAYVDCRARIDRTADYLAELCDGPLLPGERMVAEAAMKSLLTPIASDRAAAPSPEAGESRG